jgi:hypothetical protein
MEAVKFPLRTVWIHDDGRTPAQHEDAMVLRCEAWIRAKGRPTRGSQRALADVLDIHYRVRYLDHSMGDIAREYHCSKPTISRLLARF